MICMLHIALEWVVFQPGRVFILTTIVICNIQTILKTSCNIEKDTEILVAITVEFFGARIVLDSPFSNICNIKCEIKIANLYII